MWQINVAINLAITYFKWEGKLNVSEGGGGLNKISYGEAPLRSPTPLNEPSFKYE